MCDEQRYNGAQLLESLRQFDTRDTILERELEMNVHKRFTVYIHCETR